MSDEILYTVQYSVDGRFINKYRFAKVAAREIGINYTSICKALNGERNTAGGYAWRRMSANEITETIEMVNKPVKLRNDYFDNQEYLKYNIGQYNKSGDLIEIFPNMTQASKKTGVDYTGIKRNISGKQKSAGGYIWKRIEKQN